MADVGMFGTPEGIRAYERDVRDAVTTGLSAEESLGRLAMQPLQRRKLAAEAEKLESDLDSERKLAAMMQAAASGQTASGLRGSPAEQFDSLSSMAANAGLITKAQELAKTAALLRSRDASAANSSAQRARAILQRQRDEINLTGQLFGGATDETSWKRANASFEFQTGRPSPYADMPYSPDLIKQIQSNALTVKERLDLEEGRLKRLELTAYRNNRLAQFNAEQATRDARLALERAREARLAKQGGKNVTSPTTQELDQVRRLINKDFSGMAAEDVSDAAYQIASEARALRRENPALDAAQALQQAYNSARASGDFQAGHSWYGGSKPRFTGQGKTAATAASLPSGSDKLIEGRYYINSVGSVAKWTKQGFVIVPQSGLPLSSDNGGADKDEEEED